MKTQDLNGILLIDKPLDISSNALLQKVRYHLGKPKAGHAGTLDPLATGMLIVCLGHATKINQFLLNKSKYYTATLQFGIQTDSEDKEGKIIAQYDLSQVSLQLLTIEKVLATLLGKQQQIPPQYSALKHQGKPMYEYARKGIKVDKPAREITIHHITIVSFSQPYLTLGIHCSKGTYIRSLVRDIGLKIGCGATLTALRREWIEPFENANNMLSLEKCLSLTTDEILNNHLLPIDSAIKDLPKIILTEQEELKFKQGQKINLPEKELLNSIKSNSLYRIYNKEAECIAIGESKENLLKTKRLLIT